MKPFVDMVECCCIHEKDFLCEGLTILLHEEKRNHITKCVPNSSDKYRQEKINMTCPDEVPYNKVK